MAKLSQFLVIAPAAIKPDLKIVVTADQGMFAALEAANFDAANSLPRPWLRSTPRSSPGRSAVFDAASGRDRNPGWGP